MPPQRVSGGASLLVAYNLAGKSVLVVGGSATAASRVFAALEADAGHVTVVAPADELCAELAARARAKEVTHIPRDFDEAKDLAAADDIKGVVFVALEDSVRSKQVAMACRKRKIPVHCSGFPEYSDFFLTATFRDHSLQISVSSGGNGPTLANRVRNHIAATLPPSVGKAMQRLSVLRQKLREADHLTGAERSALLRHVSEEWPFDQIAQLSDLQIADLVEGVDKRLSSVLRAKGRVQIVEATTDNIENLTLGAYRALANPDSLVLAAPGTSDDILAAVSGDLVVVKDGPAEAEPKIAAALEAGRNAVWLAKGASKSVELQKWLESKGFEHTAFAAPEAVPRSVPASSKAVVDTLEAAALARTGPVEIMSGNAAVEAAVAALNDQIFIHPLSPADYLGEGITAAVQNVFGRSVRPVVRSTKLGAGNGFFGALMAGSKAACLTSGQVLPMMLPALYDIALQCHHGAVIHATADVIGEDLIRRSDYSDVLGAAASGFALLTSHSVQEAYDMAIAAQLAAARSGGSVLHVVDGGRIAQQHSQVVKLPREALVSELDKAAKDGKAPFGKALDAVFADLESHFGKRYRAIEYAGNKNPKLVYVALGSDAAVFEDAVVKSSVPAGIVKIRLYRPLDAAALLAAIPGSAEKIVVWDSVLDGNAYLYKDVAATLARQRSNLGLIRLSNASGKALTPSAIIGATKVLLRGSKTVLAADLADFAEEEVVPEGGEYLFWGTSDINIDRVTGQIAAQTAPDVSTRFLSHDALLPTVVSRAELRIGGPEVAAPAAYPVSAADITFVLADSVWAGYDVVADAKDGGIVVFNTALSDEDLDQALPLATKKAIAARRLKVLAVDATQIAKNYTIFVGKPEAYLELILRGLFSHLRSDKDGAQFMQRIREELLAVETNFTVLRTKISAVARAVRELRTVKAFTVEQDAEGQQPLKRNVDGTIRLDGPQINFGDDEDESGKFAAHKSHVAAWNIIFRESLRMDDTSMRPDVAEAQVATVTTNVRVTPESYDRNIFHMEIDISKTNLKYQMGDALAVHGLNDEKEVAEFLSDYGVRPDDVVVMRRRNAAGKEVSDTVTARQLFTMYLDVFGKPAKKFYQDLSAFAKDPDEKRTLRWLGSSDGEAEFKRRADLLYSYADVLLEFKSARVPLGDLARIIPFTKPRAYSISSSASMHPTSVHLLVVLVDWPGKDGKMRHGQCSHYLANIRPGQPIIVSLTPSVMKLPADPSTPVIMAGLGTGMAPFRAFVQEREYMRNEGANVGDMSLYFGSRHRAMEWLYGEELEVYHSDGLLTDLRLAFSRDQARKVYIQHKISEDGDRLFDLLTRQKGHFYLCGPTWPVPDIKAALIKAFVKNGYTAESAEEYLDELKERGAYVLEVY